MSFGSHLGLQPGLEIETGKLFFQGFQDKMQFETVFGSARKGILGSFEKRQIGDKINVSRGGCRFFDFLAFGDRTPILIDLGSRTSILEGSGNKKRIKTKKNVSKRIAESVSVASAMHLQHPNYHFSTPLPDLNWF